MSEIFSTIIAFADEHGYQINPMTVDIVMVGLEKRKAETGEYTCPCVVKTRVSPQHVCPCEGVHRMVLTSGRCRCNLFLRGE